jgi:Fur family transcriptional regulator, ferric uptake regulator
MDQLPPMRLTTQRRVILEELNKAASHPTAIEVYDLVSRRLPRIGLGTVYRNLELMTASGIIVKREIGGTQKRFDAVVEPHYHIRCTTCGRIDDIALEVQSRINQTAAEASKYRVLGHHIEFCGICTKCSEQEKEADIEWQIEIAMQSTG